MHAGASPDVFHCLFNTSVVGFGRKCDRPTCKYKFNARVKNVKIYGIDVGIAEQGNNVEVIKQFSIQPHPTYLST